MSPRWSEDLLSAYLDEELDARTRARVEARLAESPEWQAVLTELAEAKAAVRALPTLDLSADAWERLLAGVARDDTPVAAPRRARWAWRERLQPRTVRWAGLAGAAAAVVIVAALLLPGQHRITPKVATFNTEQQTRASLSGDPVSSLAGLGMVRGLSR